MIESDIHILKPNNAIPTPPIPLEKLTIVKKCRDMRYKLYVEVFAQLTSASLSLFSLMHHGPRHYLHSRTAWLLMSSAQ